MTAVDVTQFCFTQPSSFDNYLRPFEYQLDFCLVSHLHTSACKPCIPLGNTDCNTYFPPKLFTLGLGTPTVPIRVPIHPLMWRMTSSLGLILHISFRICTLIIQYFMIAALIFYTAVTSHWPAWEYRYESFVLGNGESKVEMEIDTRVFLPCSYWLTKSSMTDMSSSDRDPFISNLYLQQRRPHTWKLDPFSSPPELPCSIRRIQGMPPFLMLCDDAQSKSPLILISVVWRLIC